MLDTPKNDPAYDNAPTSIYTVVLDVQENPEFRKKQGSVSKGQTFTIPPMCV